jgi:molybdopterin-guanine dinucleotide biosynthesis protein A
VSRILGAVLTGGRSSRFGSDKAGALWGGQRLADHAAAALAGKVDAMVRVGGDDGIADLPRPGLGPLGGIAGALAHAEREGFDSVVTIGCDMPHLPEGLVEMLLRRAPSFCADAPVLGHWPVSLAERLIDRLAAGGERSVRGWAREVGALPVASPAPLANVNTPADLLTL